MRETKAPAKRSQHISTTIAKLLAQHLQTPAKRSQHPLKVGWKIWPVSNLSQQYSTFRNMSQQGGQSHELPGLKYYAPAQKNNQTNSHNFKTKSPPCHLKVSRHTHALNNRQWKCKQGKSWRLISLVHSGKLTNTTISHALFPAVTVSMVRDKKVCKLV